MDMPAGLAMADRGADRDGLALDRLHVPFGPLLPDWPTGLVLRTVLQGDVVQEVGVETIAGDPAAEPFWTAPWRRAVAGEHVTVGEAVRRRAAAHLDSLDRLLAVAGWPEAATGGRRLRDQVLAGAPTARIGPPLARFVRRVDRSATLRWLTRGLGVLTGDDAVAAGVTGPAARAGGDVTARYRRWLTEAVERLEDATPLRPAAVHDSHGGIDGIRLASAGALLDVLPRLLAGAELAAARLIVASLDPDLDELAAPIGAGFPRGD